MNEKIKELAKQSGFYFYDLHNIDGQDYGETIEADSWDAAENFTKLIVQVCSDWINDNVGMLDEQSRKDLMKHFGVEE